MNLPGTAYELIIIPKTNTFLDCIPAIRAGEIPLELPLNITQVLKIGILRELSGVNAPNADTWEDCSLLPESTGR
jgi:hypothetical protein